MGPSPTFQIVYLKPCTLRLRKRKKTYCVLCNDCFFESWEKRIYLYVKRSEAWLCETCREQNKKDLFTEALFFFSRLKLHVFGSVSNETAGVLEMRKLLEARGVNLTEVVFLWRDFRLKQRGLSASAAFVLSHSLKTILMRTRFDVECV